jgi:hypothetical protein
MHGCAQTLRQGSGHHATLNLALTSLGNRAGVIMAWDTRQLTAGPVKTHAHQQWKPGLNVTTAATIGDAGLRGDA